MKRCSGKIKYLYLILSNFSAPEIPQVLINRILYMFQDAEKIYDTEEVKPKRQSFSKLQPSNIWNNLLQRRDMSSLIPKLKKFKSIKA